ncbi:unnamed protein product [Rhizophagus irregularis]|nr:unnamed protein product [Rhizophagus irregularis]CAB4426626.1 unnamed protein product [Rhizophagus irregularis]
MILLDSERPPVESLYPTIFHISCQQPWSYIWYSTSSSSFTPKLVVPPAHSFTDAITIRLAYNDKYVISQLKLNKQVVVDKASAQDIGISFKHYHYQREQVKKFTKMNDFHYKQMGSFKYQFRQTTKKST